TTRVVAVGHSVDPRRVRRCVAHCAQHVTIACLFEYRDDLFEEIVDGGVTCRCDTDTLLSADQCVHEMSCAIGFSSARRALDRYEAAIKPSHPLCHIGQIVAEPPVGLTVTAKSRQFAA